MAMQGVWKALDGWIMLGQRHIRKLWRCLIVVQCPALAGCKLGTHCTVFLYSVFLSNVMMFLCVPRPSHCCLHWRNARLTWCYHLGVTLVNASLLHSLYSHDMRILDYCQVFLRIFSTGLRKGLHPSKAPYMTPVSNYSNTSYPDLLATLRAQITIYKRYTLLGYTPVH